MDDTWQHLWVRMKDWLENDLSVSTDHLHVHLGLFVFLPIALALRHWRQGPLVAWLAVALAQVLNEVLDARVWIAWTGTVNLSEAASDTILTLFWPTVLLFVWRRIGCPKGNR